MYVRWYVLDPKRTRTRTQLHTFGLSRNNCIEIIPEAPKGNPRLLHTPTSSILLNIGARHIFRSHSYSCGAFACNWSICSSIRIDPSGASSSKRNNPDNSWSQQNEIITYSRGNGIYVKHVHCERVLKMHVVLVLASSLANGGSPSEPPSLVCGRQ